MVKDAKMLRRHYLKSDSWRYDLMSLLPTDIAYYWWRPGSCDSVSIINVINMVLYRPCDPVGVPTQTQNIPAERFLGLL